MKKLVVTFYKTVFHGMEIEPTFEKVVFEHPFDEDLSTIDNWNAAYDKAVELGHCPWEHIEYKEVG